jgi:hypothetical protein
MKAELFEAIINTMFKLENEINIIKLTIIRGGHTHRLYTVCRQNNWHGMKSTGKLSMNLSRTKKKKM